MKSRRSPACCPRAYPWLAGVTVAAGLLVCGAASLPAQTAYTWNGGTGDWGNGSFWNTGTSPNNPAASVYIDGGKTGVGSAVNVGSTYTVGTLTVDAGDTLNVNTGGSLSVAGGSLVNNGTVNVNTSLQFGSSTTLAGTGTINLGGNGASLSAGHAGDRITLNTGETINGHGNVGNGQTTFTNNGAITADQTAPMVLAPGGGTADFINNGTLFAAGLCNIQFSNASGGTLTNNGGIFLADIFATFTVPAGALTNLSSL